MNECHISEEKEEKEYILRRDGEGDGGNTKSVREIPAPSLLQPQRGRLLAGPIINSTKIGLLHYPYSSLLGYSGFPFLTRAS